MQRILLVPALAALIASSATAGMIITWTETDTALTGTVSGSISAAQLALAGGPSPSTATLHRIDSGGFASINGAYDLYNFSSNTTRSNYANVNPWNSYEAPGSSGTGNNFGLMWRYYFDGGMVYYPALELPSGYVAGTALTGSLTINGSNLLTDHPLSATTFGDIITLDGSALVTYVNGNSISAVPEVTSSFTMLGLIGSGLLLRRRGRKEL